MIETNRTRMRFLIILEPTTTGHSAYSPDLPGCISTGRTRQETERNMREAIDLHLEGLQAEGLESPKPSGESAFVEISA